MDQSSRPVFSDEISAHISATYFSYPMARESYYSEKHRRLPFWGIFSAKMILNIQNENYSPVKKAAISTLNYYSQKNPTTVKVRGIDVTLRDLSIGEKQSKKFLKLSQHPKTKRNIPVSPFLMSNPAVRLCGLPDCQNGLPKSEPGCST